MKQKVRNSSDISQYIKFNSKKRGKKNAIIFQNKKISYKQLENYISNLSNFFINFGIKKDDRIAVVLSNSLEFVYIMFAAARIGATIVPYNVTLPVKIMKKSFLYTKINFLIGWHKVVEKIFKERNIERIINKRNAITVGNKSIKFKNFDEFANKKYSLIRIKKTRNLLNNDYIIALTSGSTGNPKPIILTQKTKLLRSLYTKNIYNLNSKSVVIASTPLYHTLAQRLVLLPIIMGGTSIILSGFSTKKWFSEVKKNNVTFSMLVSSQIENIVNYKKNIFSKLKSLKTIVSSSAKLHEDAKNKIKILKSPNFYEIYGTSEIAAVTNMKINGNTSKINSVGKKNSFASIKIIDNKNRFQKSGTIGEIICKTPLIFSGYLNKPNKTSLCFHKGYFKTGDMGYLDKDDYLYFSSRKKNIIIVGGINVYPEDIEKSLKKNSQVKDCCVFGVKNKILGEQIIASIIPQKKIINENKLKEYCSENLADFQQPRYYTFVKKFPTSTLGKIDRKKLIKNFLSGEENKK